MANFDEKFGPRPVHVSDEARVLATQGAVVFVMAMAIQPSFLYRPNTSDVSPTLSLLFALLVVVATIATHRSFIQPA